MQIAANHLINDMFDIHAGFVVESVWGVSILDCTAS